MHACWNQPCNGTENVPTRCHPHDSGNVAIICRLLHWSLTCSALVGFKDHCINCYQELTLCSCLAESIQDITQTVCHLYHSSCTYTCISTLLGSVSSMQSRHSLYCFHYQWGTVLFSLMVQWILFSSTIVHGHWETKYLHENYSTRTYQCRVSRFGIDSVSTLICKEMFMYNGLEWHLAHIRNSLSLHRCLKFCE